jgi:hypothetical protein
MKSKCKYLLCIKIILKLDLNTYQIACKPRLLEKGSTNESEYITMDLFDKLKEGLLCPVCAEIYKNPLNVRQCLHKFCLNCIEDYNRIYKKECPGCRAVIGSRRQLRKDECLQSLISSLITNTDKFNELENLRR